MLIKVSAKYLERLIKYITPNENLNSSELWTPVWCQVVCGFINVADSNTLSYYEVEENRNKLYMSCTKCRNEYHNRIFSCKWWLAEFKGNCGHAQIYALYIIKICANKDSTFHSFITYKSVMLIYTLKRTVPTTIMHLNGSLWNKWLSSWRVPKTVI